MADLFDVLIVGGGPAGLSAALVLGRCCRKVIICDSNHPRNYAARHLHNYATRDGIAPADYRRLARRELIRYGVKVLDRTVTDVRCIRPDSKSASPRASCFEARLSTGQQFRCRKIVLATGVLDILPDIQGFKKYYGAGVHHCPYCDAWEYRDRPLVALGRGKKGVGLALALRNWSRQVLACTNGTPVPRTERRRLERLGVAVQTGPVARLIGRRGRLTGVELAGGSRIRCAALFFNTGQVQRSHLPLGLGCVVNRGGGIQVDRHGRTGVPGLYLAGDASRDVQFVVTAAADGARAAVAINRELQDEQNSSL